MIKAGEGVAIFVVSKVILIGLYYGVPAVKVPLLPVARSLTFLSTILKLVG